MIVKPSISCLLLILAMVMSLPFSSSGHTTTYVDFKSRANLIIDAPITISDPQRNDPATANGALVYVANYQATVHLIYGREQRTDVAGKYWAYRIHYDLYESTSTMPDQSGILTISHNNGSGVYEALENYVSTTGSVRLVVTAIEGSLDNFSTAGNSDPTWIDQNVPADIRLELRMQTERYDYLDKMAQPANHQGTYTAATHSMKIQWSHVQGAENYEIEWVYLDDEVLSPPSTSELFRRAARVEVIGNEYDLSITYPRGSLYYRIRAVGRYIRSVTDGDYSRIKNAAWLESGAYSLTPFEVGKNWQYTSTFAEEGKYKKVISYYDEGLKNRQTQTNLSSEEQTLVATSHYDVEGRPALSILPVPDLGNNDLFYKPQFNKNENNQSYNRINFDKNLGNTCQYNLPDPLDKGQGAAYYFSPNHANSSDDDLYKDMIPDAAQYPMTQVRFLNDGTGRIAAQSGVGEFFQLGSGRETRYFYDDPSSFQLRRLFGSNVGEAKYYKRNVVMDANGQISVSYIDIAGRVVATALAGVAPENVEELDSYTDPASSNTVVENLLDNNVILFEEGLSRTISTVMNEQAGNTATFDYDLAGLNESLDTGVDINGDGNNDPICLSCEYEVKIRVYDPCGEPVEINNDSTARSKYIIQTTFTGANACTNTTYPTGVITFAITMSQVGLYRVEKELRVKELDSEDYRNLLNAYFPSTAALETWVGVDSLSCYVTCEQRCRYELKQLNGPTYEPTATEIASCVASYENSGACGDADDFYTTITAAECEGILTQILNQVSPEGCKYIQGEWWNVDVNGSMVNLIAGLQFPYNGSLVSGSDANFHEVLINPDEWQEEWAAILAEAHPEYCQYLLCIHSEIEREWTLRFRDLPDWNGIAWPTTAQQNTIFNELINNASSTDRDPTYGVTGFYPSYNNNPALSTTVKMDIGSALLPITSSTDPAIIGAALATKVYDRLTLYGECPSAGNPKNVFDYLDCTMSSATDAEKWQTFKGIYLGERYKLLNSIRRGWCPAQEDCSIVGDTDLFDIPPPVGSDVSGTEAGIDDFVNENNISICASLCEYRVEEWLQALVNGCPELGDPNNVAIYDNIKSELFDYCLGSCGPENPMAYLLEEDLTTGPLATVDNLLGNNNLCGGVEADVLDEMAAPFEQVYVYYRDENGAKVCTTSTLINPCFFAVIDGLRSLIESGNCATNATYTPNPASNCYDFVKISEGGSDPDFITVGSMLPELSCCDQFEIVNSSGTRIDPCSLDYIGSPWLANGNIFIDGFIGFNQATYQIQCIEINGFLGGPNFDLELSESCLYNTESYCYVLALDSLIDIDTLFEACIEEALLWTTLEAERIREDSIARIISRVLNQRDCLNGHVETFTVSYPSREHHYTLYYYDQAGNLIETVPPEGVQPLPLSAFTNGAWDQSSEPVHEQRTKYQYNTLGQVVWQHSPDGGATEFKYDYAQRLRASENAKQALENTYSYTRYDAQGRIIEVGELTTPTGTANEFDNLTDSQLNDFDFPDSNNGVLEEQTYTDYNVASLPAGGSFNQENLRGRVAMTYNTWIRTHYSYDPHGNVQDLQHQISGLTVGGNQQYQTLHYDYDLISGNVKEVAYQSGKVDQFYHRYDYDADNRLTDVHTSENGWLWENDARYFYYAHGPLARVELGEDKVQGLDYYYTLQGWIKGVNSTGANSHEYEAGQDGHLLANNRNQWLGRDAYGYALQYYDGDYASIGTTNLGGADNDFWSVANTHILSQSGKPAGLYNGNIVGMLTDIKQFNNSGIEGLQAMSYRYDQLHRIQSAHSYDTSAGTNLGQVTFDATNNDYQSSYTYDANGNLKTLSRQGPSGQMDQLSYTYALNKPNQLSHVDDAISNSLYGEDVDDQNPDNYGYDLIGNLTKDVQGQVNNISWTVYGKVDEVTHASGDYEKTAYKYDPAGNRLSKRRIPASNSTLSEVITYYVRDASGNVLSIYEEEIPNGGQEGSGIKQKEVSLYGSARLGQRKFSDRVLGTSVGELIRDRGNRGYELSNHLGNVLSVISDYKEGVVGSNLWEAEYYEPLVRSAQDYYAFGMVMPRRSLVVSGNEYRYGFNGKEKDENEELGLLTHYDYGFRIYNPGVGRFLSVDPLTRGYPMLTPYQYASNSPVANIDLDGLERYYYLQTTNTDGTVHLDLVGIEDIYKKVPNGTEWHGNVAVTKYKEVISNDRQEHIVTARGIPLLPDIFSPDLGAIEKSQTFETFDEVVNSPPIEFTRGEILSKAFSNGASIATMTGGGSGSVNGIRGFKSFGQLRQFGTAIQAGLVKLGFKNTKLFMQGSSVTGRSFKSGKPFDAGRVSDFDVALANEDLFEKAKKLGLVDKTSKSIPIEVGTEAADALGINEIIKRLSETLKRPVNVRVFKNEEAVREAGKTVFIPTKQNSTR